jgi:hypothetical protein
MATPLPPILRHTDATGTWEVRTANCSCTGERHRGNGREVLPVLDSIYIVKQPVSCVEKFLAARRLSGHPVTVVETSAAFRKSQVCEDETISSQVS